MENEPQCQIRRRRSSGNPNLALNLEVGFQVSEGGPSQGTPSPSRFKESNDQSPANILREFKKKQQSFDLQEIEIEECEEEDIMVDSEEDGEEEGSIAAGDRPITPTPIQDFGANVVYTEGPQTMDFLKVKPIENECVTDVSDAEDNEEE